VSFGNGTDGRPGGRFGAATPGVRSERSQISGLAAMRVPGQSSRRRRVITPWRTTALIAAIIVAGGSYALGRYVIAPKPPPEVRLAVTTKALAPGAPLTTADLAMVTVRRSSVPAGALPWAAAKGLIDQIAKDTIPPGTLLTGGMLAAGVKMPDATHDLIGLALKPGQLPAGGLAVGQQVTIMLLTGSAQSIPAALPGATIWALLPQDSSGVEQVTVLVRHQLMKEVASYAAHGQVSLVATAAPPPR
jgi:hypothetical protein